MSDKLINVIIPVYNSVDELDCSLNSLLNQTYQNWHAIIVDDGSTDGSIEKCKSFCEKYQNKFEFYSINHAGPGGARNYAMNLSDKNAGYWYFMDSDDYIDSSTFSKLVSAIERDNSDIAVCGYVRHIGSRFKEIYYSKGSLIEPKDVFVSLLEGDDIGSFSCNKLFRYDLLVNLKYPENCFYEDILFFYQVLSKCKKISVIKDALYHYVWHKTSVVASKDELTLKDFKKAISERNKFVENQFPELKDNLIINNLNVNIFILNRMCKAFGTDALKKYSEEFNFIKQNSKFFNKLNLKNNVIAHFIVFAPKFYAKTMYVFRDFFLLN